MRAYHWVVCVCWNFGKLEFFLCPFVCLRTFSLVFEAFSHEIHQNQNYRNQYIALQHIQTHIDRIYGKSFVDWKQWPPQEEDKCLIPKANDHDIDDTNREKT